MLKSLVIFLFCVTSSSLAIAAPDRIASGTVGTDEILLELLKGEESRIVAVSHFAEDPRYSFISAVPKSIRGRVGGNIENLLLQKPDLVFIASYTAASIAEQLKAAKVKVHVQKSFGSFRDIKENIHEVGRLIGKTKESNALVSDMETKVSAALKKQTACARKPSFLQYVASDFLPGKGTIIDDVGEIAGYHNVLRDIDWQGWTQISQEILVQQKPDVILASAADAANKDEFLKKLREHAAWQKMDAVKEGRVIFVPDRLLYTVSQHATELVTFLIENRPCSVRKN
ncbi:MAG: ABC transporter substrate-binding protein [Proteobacteria bacterium]|nr:MAG: ABC transporter substrate-binding protein [Pseudomonadota bacterium]